MSADRVESRGADLTGSRVPTAQVKKASLATEEINHRVKQQKTISFFVIVLIYLLYIAGVGLSVGVLWFTNEPIAEAKWHIWVLVLAFLTPLTILSVTLIRATYRRMDRDDVTDNLPALSLVKEITKAGVEAVKAVKN